MRVARKFKQLTRTTNPHGTENGLVGHMPSGYQKDDFGNWYVQIGKSNSMFTCHMDTADQSQKNVIHVENGNMISTDGRSILGADDKAGMVVLLYMIENKIPGLYYFFVGEECGCVGSRKVSAAWKNLEFSKYINKVVAFDRRGTDSVITHQLWQQCCSDEFAKDLANRLNQAGSGLKYKPDDTGIYTDSAQFTGVVPECTNISVGYYSEHTINERQDIDFLRRLCEAACKVDWETLPIERNPAVVKKKYADEYDRYYGGGSEWYDDDYNTTNNKWADSGFGTADPRRGGVDRGRFSKDNYSWFIINGETKKMYISNDQITTERADIYNWLFRQDSYPNMCGLTWNGNLLYVDTGNNLEYVGNRYDLTGMIPELGSVSLKELKDNID